METLGHSQRVIAYSIAIAKSAHVPLQYLSVLARVAFLHDIGKMTISDKILGKPGPLDDAEKVIMRSDCEIGYNTLTRIPSCVEPPTLSSPTMSSSMVWGYPRGLHGELGHGSSPSPNTLV